MSAIAQAAQRMSLLFEYGVVGPGEVTEWADSLILQIDSPPDALLELSTCSPCKTGDILSFLRRLSAGADFWVALRGAVPQIREYVASHRDRAASIANHLFFTAQGFDSSEVPDDFNFLYSLHDAFCLALEGTYGDSESVYRRFIHELDKFALVA